MMNKPSKFWGVVWGVWSGFFEVSWISIKLRLNTSKTSKISKFMKKKFFLAFWCCKNAYKGRSFFSALFQLFKAFSWKNHNCKNLTISKFHRKNGRLLRRVGVRFFYRYQKSKALTFPKTWRKCFKNRTHPLGCRIWTILVKNWLGSYGSIGLSTESQNVKIQNLQNFIAKMVPSFVEWACGFSIDIKNQKP